MSVQYNAAVSFTGDLERDPSRQVRFNEARDNIDGRFLRREDQVDADGATFLSQSNDVCFHVLASGHHQVRHFVSDDDDEWQVNRYRISFFFVFWRQSFEDLFVAKLIIGRNVPNARFGQQLIAFLHLVDGPRENRFGFSHVGDDWMHQVG